MSVSANGRYLLAPSFDKSLKLVDLDRREIRITWPALPETLKMGACFSRDGITIYRLSWVSNRDVQPLNGKTFRLDRIDLSDNRVTSIDLPHNFSLYPVCIDSAPENDYLWIGGTILFHLPSKQVVCNLEYLNKDGAVQNMGSTHYLGGWVGV